MAIWNRKSQGSSLEKPPAIPEDHIDESPIQDGGQEELDKGTQLHRGLKARHITMIGNSPIEGSNDTT